MRTPRSATSGRTDHCRRAAFGPKSASEARASGSRTARHRPDRVQAEICGLRARLRLVDRTIAGEPPSDQSRRQKLAHQVRVLRVIARIEFKLKYADSALGYVWSIAPLQESRLRTKVGVRSSRIRFAYCASSPGSSSS